MRTTSVPLYPAFASRETTLAVLVSSLQTPESSTIVTWHESNASATWRPRFPSCGSCLPHNSLSVYKLEPAAITSRALLSVVWVAPQQRFPVSYPTRGSHARARTHVAVTPGGNQNRVLCARDILPAYDMAEEEDATVTRLRRRRVEFAGVNGERKERTRYTNGLSFIFAGFP